MILRMVAFAGGLLCCGAIYGCNVEKIANMTEGGTQLSGKNAAIGGLNYSKAHDAAKGWDKHIDGCRYNAGDHSFSFRSYGSAVLHVDGDTKSIQVGTRGESGNVLFSAAECTGSKLMPVANKLDAARRDGEMVILCERDGDTLQGSIRFAGCGA